jgi:hypothetical protein
MVSKYSKETIVSLPGNESLGYKHCQYFDCCMMTFLTVAMPVLVAAVSFKRSGGSPINVLVTATADLEIDSRL